MRNKMSFLSAVNRTAGRAKLRMEPISILRNSSRWCIFAVMFAVCILLCGGRAEVYADEPTPTPTVTEAPGKNDTQEGSTMIKDGVSDSYIGTVTDGINTTVNGLVNNDEDTVNSIVRKGMETLEKVIYYIPFVGIGVFLVGAFIAIFSILNKSNRRWGIRMAVVTSIALYAAYIFIILIYDVNFIGKQPAAVIRPENLDHYGEVYFDVWEEVLDAERLAGLADKTLSTDVISILRLFYQESAMDVGVVVFGLGLLLSIIMKRNPVLKKWAGIVLCVVVPIVLYVGYWYISRLS